MEAWVCREDELIQGAVRVAQLGRDADGRPVQALVLRNGTGGIVAYRNLCKHLPVPLDGGTGKVLAEDGAHLICGTHGATYRLEDGYCVDGPCEGASLEPLRVRVAAGNLYVSRSR